MIKYPVFASFAYYEDASTSQALMITLAVCFGLVFSFWMCKKCLPKRKKRTKKGVNVDADDSKAIKFASSLHKQMVGILRYT